MKKYYFWHRYLEKVIPNSRTLYAFNVSVFALIITAASNLIFLQDAYSQPEPSPDSLLGNLLEQQQQQQQPPSLVSNNTNVTTSIAGNATTGNATTGNATTGNATGDFMTIREQYLSSWERLSFSSAFDTFLSSLSPFVQAYGGYEPRQSNVFGPGDTISLYVEPVGFAHEENIDPLGNPIYRVNLSAVITVSGSQGNIVGTLDVPFTEQTSYRKVTELFLVLDITQSPEPFPVGEYVATYTITDNITGESFELVKDFRVAEVVGPG